MKTFSKIIIILVVFVLSLLASSNFSNHDIRARNNTRKIHAKSKNPDGSFKILVSFKIFLTQLICNILNFQVWPAEWSHWINMKKIIEQLHSRGHNITVIRPSTYSDFILPADEYTLTDLPVPEYKPGFHLTHLQHILDIFKLGENPSPWYKKAYNMVQFWMTHITHRYFTCKKMMQNTELLEEFLLEDFDVLIADPCVICGELIATYLDIPFVHNVRILPGDMQQQVAGAPLPVAYVPLINTVMTDKMSFFQRLTNTVNYIFQTAFTKLGLYFYADPIIRDHMKGIVPDGTTILDIQRKAALWLIRLDFSFEFPRPLMPHTKYIGGFHCSPSNISKLSPELTKFLDSADEGVIVFSMGSMVDRMSLKKSEIIARALADVDAGYKIVWRYNGEKPRNLGKNTLLQPWLPQNDLLGHPKIKLFMTHKQC